MAVWVVVVLLLGKRPLASASRDFKWMFSAFVIWFILILFDGLRTSTTSVWLAEVMLKAPLIIVPLYMMCIPKRDCKFENSWLFFVSVIALVAVISGVNYALNYEEINKLLLQSKHIPLLGNIHHIYFGVYQALGIWVAVYFLQGGQYKGVWRVLLIVLLLMIHILASRTGLLAFYASVGVFILVKAKETGRIKPLIIGLGLLLTVPLIGYQFSTSFRNKVLNSAEDFEAVQSGKDINYKSLAMRVEAWKTGTGVFKEHPWLGVGTSRVDEAMQDQYRRNRTVLYPENRIGPHNQFLEMSMAHGIFAAGLLIIVFGLAYLNRVDSPVFLGLLTVFFISFLLESYLERQQGIVAFCLVFYGFYPLTGHMAKET